MADAPEVKRIRVLYIQQGRGIGGAKISLLHLLNSEMPGVDRELALSPPVDSQFIDLLGKKVSAIHTLTLPVWYKRKTAGLRGLLETLVRLGRGWYLLPTLRLVLIILSRRVDLVHSNSSATPVGAFAAKLTRRPHIWHIRESIGNNNQFPLRVGDKIAAWIFRWSNTVIVCNSQYTASFFNAFGIPTHIIYNGLRLDEFAESKDRGLELKHQLSLFGEEPIVGMVGSLGSEMKEHGLFLEAMALVLAACPSCRMVVFGSETDLQKKEYTRRLALQAKQLMLEDNLRWIGKIDDVAAMMGCLDVLVHPTANEGSGRVVMEAMAAGKPVVAVRSGGVQELIRDGETGFMVPSMDASAMAAAVLKLIGDEKLRAAMGLRAQEIAREWFSHQRTQQEILAVYKNAL